MHTIVYWHEIPAELCSASWQASKGLTLGDNVLWDSSMRCRSKLISSAAAAPSWMAGSEAACLRCARVPAAGPAWSSARSASAETAAAPSSCCLLLLLPAPPLSLPLSPSSSQPLPLPGMLPTSPPRLASPSSTIVPLASLDPVSCNCTQSVAKRFPTLFYDKAPLVRGMLALFPQEAGQHVC